MKKNIFLFSLILTLIISFANSSFAQTRKKKGMSSQAKGAIIGGAGGAVAGGLIGGNAKGAIIGGALGAGGGYVVGNETRRAKEKKAKANRRAKYRRAQ